jgi:uncharacterized protein with HEPN domain
MSEKDNGNLLAIQDCCQKISDFTKELWDATSFFHDEKTFDAVLMNFVKIGESVSRLSLSFKGMHHQKPWSMIRGFHNIVTYD